MRRLRRLIRWHLIPAYIHYSRSCQYYYITWGTWAAHRPRYWASIRVDPGPVPDAHKHDNWRGWLQVDPRGPATFATYHRMYLPFAFFDMDTAHPERTERIDKADPRFRDYVALSRWEY